MVSLVEVVTVVEVVVVQTFMRAGVSETQENVISQLATTSAGVSPLNAPSATNSLHCEK